MTEYPIHPAALIFPMMGDAELAELAEDIRKNGLLEPVVLYEGVVLDGRNRLAACRIAGVEPKFSTVHDIQPMTYVVGKNLHRRHLTTSQCGAIAVEVEPQLKAEALERQRKGGETAGRGRPRPDNKVVQVPAQPISSNDSSETKGRSRDIAAKMMGVSHYTVDNARAVKKADPEEFERIKRGEVTVEAAHRKVVQAKPEPAEQPAPKRPSKSTGKRQAMVDNAAKRRMVDGLSGVEGSCQGLMKLNIPAIQGSCSSEELRTWVSSARESAKQLRAFAALLAPAKETGSE